VEGKVYLVGAGPGDPELLTLKALRLLREADVVLHDALVSPEVLALIPGNVIAVNVGKRCGWKAITQEQIHERMIAFSLSGKTVVRLKCGDPMIFGRGGEEIDALLQAGIDVEVVPGITSALAAAAAARLSLTHRSVASSVVLVTAHHAKSSRTDWKALAASGSTVAFYMPGNRYAEISRDLIQAGLAEDVPCVIVSRASSQAQQIHSTTVGALAQAPELAAPSILLLGEALSADSMARNAASLADPMAHQSRSSSAMEAIQ
jgi:uroporphyrin-III C-methyltransferase